LLTVDTPSNLRQRLYGRKVVFHVEHLEPGWGERVGGLPFVKGVEIVGNKLVVGLENPEKQNPVIVRLLVEIGADLQFVGEVRHSLEDVYLNFINQSAQ
jgi:ABC-2 type transport system ATP-binding protein